MRHRRRSPSTEWRQPPGGGPPSTPPKRSLTSFTIPSTRGEPVGGTIVVVGGGVVGGAVVGPPAVGGVVAVVGPRPAVVADGPAVVDGRPTCAKANGVALSASWIVDRSGSVATPWSRATKPQFAP